MSEDLAPPPLGEARKRSGLRIFGRFLWNAMAIMGILAVTATIGGLIYGFTQFSGMNGSELASQEPIDVPGLDAPKAGLGAEFDLPEDYVEARLAPLPPLESYPLPLATLSVRVPFERILAHTTIADGAISLSPASVDATEEWLEQSDLGYVCDDDADKYYTVTDQTEPLLAASLHCERDLLPYEAQAAGTDRGHLLLYLFTKDKDSILVQLTVAGDEAEASGKSQKLMRGFTWP